VFIPASLIVCRQLTLGINSCVEIRLLSGSRFIRTCEGILIAQVNSAVDVLKSWEGGILEYIVSKSLNPVLVRIYLNRRYQSLCSRVAFSP